MLEKKIDSLLEEASRWKQEVQKGNISDKNMRLLRKKGVTKTDDQLAAGMKKGSEELLKKHAPDTIFADNRGIANAGGGAASVRFGGATPNEIYINEKPGRFIRFSSPMYSNFEKPELSKEILRRHEVNEVLAGKNYVKNLNKSLDKREGSSDYHLRKMTGHGNLYDNYNINAFLTKKNTLGQQSVIGAHNSMDVLTKEAADVNRMAYTDAAKRIKNHRKNTGESQIMKDYFGKGYNDINDENLGKINKSIHQFENRYGDESPERHGNPKGGLYKPFKTPKTPLNIAKDATGAALIPGALGYGLYSLFSDGDTPEN